MIIFVSFHFIIKHAKENLANIIVNEPEFKAGNYEQAFINAFRSEDSELTQTFGRQKIGGTTVTGK